VLRAIRKKDGETVEAWSQKESAGPFCCPSCGNEVVLRNGKRRLDHFAHAPERTCRYDLGESEHHRRCKAEIWVCLKDAPHVSDVQLERGLGEVRADVSAWINNVPVAIEVQMSALSLETIIHRTTEYAKKGIYVLWLLQWTPYLDGQRYSPRLWEKWVHAAYFGRVYYWIKGLTIACYHFDPHYMKIPETSWYSEDGEKVSAGGYTRKSKRYRTPIRGRTLNLATDFVPRNRDRWEGNDLIIPPATLYMDRHGHTAPVADRWQPSRRHAGR
jgi:competence protein CoiA